MSLTLLNSACSNLVCQKKSKTYAWFKLMTSLKIMFEFELMEKSESLRLA